MPCLVKFHTISTKPFCFSIIFAHLPSKIPLSFQIGDTHAIQQHEHIWFTHWQIQIRYHCDVWRGYSIFALVVFAKTWHSYQLWQTNLLSNWHPINSQLFLHQNHTKNRSLQAKPKSEAVFYGSTFLATNKKPLSCFK